MLIAMGFGNTEIVSLLLEHGADPYECDIGGNDALMMASLFGRTDNVELYRQFEQLINQGGRSIKTLRGMFRFKKDRPPVPLREVEPWT